MANDKYTPIDWSTTPSQDIGMSTQPTYGSLTAGSVQPSYTDPMATQPLMDYGPTIQNASRLAPVGGWLNDTQEFKDYVSQQDNSIFSQLFDALSPQSADAKMRGSDPIWNKKPPHLATRLTSAVEETPVSTAAAPVAKTTPVTAPVVKISGTVFGGVSRTHLDSVFGEVAPRLVEVQYTGTGNGTDDEIASEVYSMSGADQVKDSRGNVVIIPYSDLSIPAKNILKAGAKNIKAAQQLINSTIPQIQNKEQAREYLKNKGVIDADETFNETFIKEVGGDVTALRDTLVAQYKGFANQTIVGSVTEDSELQKALRVTGKDPKTIIDSVGDSAGYNFQEVLNDASKQTLFKGVMHERGNITIEKVDAKEVDSGEVYDVYKDVEDLLLAEFGNDPEALSNMNSDDRMAFNDKIRPIIAARYYNANPDVGTWKDVQTATVGTTASRDMAMQSKISTAIGMVVNKNGKLETESQRGTVEKKLDAYTTPEYAETAAYDDLNIDKKTATKEALSAAAAYARSVKQLADRHKVDLESANTPEKVREINRAFDRDLDAIKIRAIDRLDVPTKNFFGTEDKRTGKQLSYDWAASVLPLVSLGMGIYSLTYGKKKDREDALEDQKDLYAWQLQQQLGYQQGLYNIYNPTTTDSGDGDSGGGVSYARTDVKVGAL